MQIAPWQHLRAVASRLNLNPHVTALQPPKSLSPARQEIPHASSRAEVKALSCALQGGAAGAALPAVLPALLTMVDDAAQSIQRTGEASNPCQPVCHDAHGTCDCVVLQTGFTWNANTTRRHVRTALRCLLGAFWVTQCQEPL